MRQLEHVAEERLEDFARRDCVPGADFADIHNHIANCPLCQERLSELTEFVAFMRAMPRDTAGQVRSRHETASGTVFLIVAGADAHSWEARVLDGGEYTICEFLRGAQAKTFLEHWFSRAYPEHRCTAACSAAWK